MAQLTVTVPDALLPIFTRFQVINGLTWLDAYVTQKLTELALQFRQSDGLSAATNSPLLTRSIAEKWSTLTPSQQAAALAIFGL